MGTKTPFLISIALHTLLLLLSYMHVGGMFSHKTKDKGYVVFDYVEVGAKSKAPILSSEEGKISRKKARIDEKENEQQKSQTDKSPKEKENKIEKTKEQKEKTVAIDKKKKQQKPRKKDTGKKKSEKKVGKSSKTEDKKAVVNLGRNKKNKNNDQKVAKKSFNSLLDSASASGDNENSGIKAEEVGDVLTATQIDLIRQTIRKCWHFPAGLRNAEDLVVDIKMELDPKGNVTSAEIVDKNRMASDPDYRTAAENAYRAVLDPKCNPLPLPKDHYNEWKDLELSFNPKDMF